MIRIRGKAIGLGLALAAGPLAAQPALLPPTVRTGDWSAGAASDAVWFPARTPTSPPAPRPAPMPVIPTPPAVVPTVTPPATVRPVQAEGEPVNLGPRTAAVSTDLGPLPAIPSLPDAAPDPQPFPIAADLPPAPSIPTAMPTRPTLQPQPAPAPRPVEPLPIPPAPKQAEPQPIVPVPVPKLAEPPPIPPAKAEPVPPSDAPLPRPQPLPTPQPELQTAPPELLVPSGYHLPPRHTAFGSDPVRISRDYPSLHDLFRVHHDRTAGPDGGDDPGAAPAADRGYVRLEYLLWWVNPQRIPVLASTSTTGGLGFLGEPGTALLLGPGRLGDNPQSGFRVRGGWWCDEDGHLGVDGSYFFLGRDTTNTTFDSADTPTITRPFFAANDGGFEFGERVARPGFSRGTLTVDSTSSLYGFDANLRHSLCRTCGYRNEVFVGYRFLGLNESLTVTEFITALPLSPDPAGTRIVVQDQFRTTNRFHGGQLGYAAERNWGRLSLDGRASVALGNTAQTVEVTGFQQRQRPGETAMLFTNGGLLAAGPNLGRFTDNRFSVVPEVSFNLGYWITPSVKAYVGYNALYWSNVVRPGDQIDRTIDVTFIPNPPLNPATGQVPAFSGLNRPAVPFKQDHLWVNGIQFGAEWRW